MLPPLPQGCALAAIASAPATSLTTTTPVVYEIFLHYMYVCMYVCMYVNLYLNTGNHQLSLS